ncbi:unnamed protein product, partial [Mesorhabditis belari]|uniref:Uncharacterized protein n=1 Tax=Mesorhabditis belari TaxID=2138241 RepID=A0AAF3ETY1_9BILA
MGDKSAYMGVGAYCGGSTAGHGYAREEYAYGEAAKRAQQQSGSGVGEQQQQQSQSQSQSQQQQQQLPPGVTKPRTDVSCYMGPI